MLAGNLCEFVAEACGEGRKAFVIDGAHVYGDVVRNEVAAGGHDSLRVELAADAPRNLDGLKTAPECPGKSTLDQPLESVLETLEAHAR